MKRFYFFVFFILISTLTFSQGADSPGFKVDSTHVDKEYGEENIPDSYASPDRTNIAARNFDNKTLNDLKSDPAFQYKEPPTIAESLWDRFLLWLGQLIQFIFESAVTTNWGRVFTYILGISVVVVLIMMILRVNAFKVFYSGQGANTFKYNVLDENIHEMDFEKLIQEAMSKNDYRIGVRLVFLFALKMLSDRNLIHWDQGKTNHDYLDELNAVDLKNGFSELNYYFEYAWYGNFTINQELFSKVQLIFNEWKGKLR